MALPGVPTIPEQFKQALSDDDNIRTIIFDGGGNDVLISGQSICRTSGYSGELSEDDLSEDCHQMISRVEGVDEAFYWDMINADVKNIVQQGYYFAKDQNLWLVAGVFQKKPSNYGNT